VVPWWQDVDMDTEPQLDGESVAPDLDDFDEVVEIEHESLPSDRYFDRELSWLRFNQRVLELGEDRTQPLLERANFLAIFASNLDEFFMVRVAGLKRRIDTGIAVPTNVGRAPSDVLRDIAKKAHELQDRHAQAFIGSLKPDLDAAGIHIEHWSDLDEADRLRMREYFNEQIFPVLMPLAVDPAHPFPYISGLSLNLAVRVRNPKSQRQEFARLKVPQNFSRFIKLPDDNSGRMRFIPLEDLIANHLDDLFPGMEVLEHHVFRVTRNEDVEIEEDEAENLIQAVAGSGRPSASRSPRTWTR
jgi:polyphosphate kinase